ncbi:MAG: SIMPL domain-containing protein [Sedimenticola sp.]
MKHRVLAILALLASTTLWADTAPLTYDRINLSVSAGQEMENDTLIAILYVQREGREAAKPAREVNTAISRAIGKAKLVPGIKSSTLDYSTSPIYSKSSSFSGNKITGWRVRQSLRLESKDTTALSNLLGKLQEELALSNIQYTVSPEKREEAQQRLIAEAIGKFKRRATLVSGELDTDDYRLVNMNINTSGVSPRHFPVRAMAMEMKSAPPPALEAGTQRIEVSVSGTIELKR